MPIDGEDYLEEDQEISHQKYVCLSFISPEDVIKRKEIYYMEHFLKSLIGEVNELFDFVSKQDDEKSQLVHAIKERYTHLFKNDLGEQYTYFKDNDKTLEKKYFEENDFQTTIRGLKVRGSYETIKEAQIRSKVLQRKDPVHNVFIAQVGCWCPWAPNPDDIKDQEYSENQLNELMKKYTDNRDQVDTVFDKRTKQLIEKNKKENEGKEKKPMVELLEGQEEKEQLKHHGAIKKVDESTIENEIVDLKYEDKPTEPVLGAHDDKDPWLQRKESLEKSKKGIPRKIKEVDSN
jgi:hypothetical protein